jgi:hypothetical protein
VPEVYWICLLGGLALAVVVLFVGDVLDGVLDGALDALGHGLLDPLSLVGGVTAFGGAGVVLTETTALGDGATAALAAAAALLLALGLHFAYVRPMKRGENSTAFSLKEYVGRAGEVNTAVPPRGYGEVLVRMGASTTFQPAASADGSAIPAGTPVVVVEVEPDGALRVVPFEEGGEKAVERGWRAEIPRPRRRLRS